MADLFDKAYIVAVDMGYGHQRAAFPLARFAAVPDGWDVDSKIISANSYPGIPFSDKARWNSTRKIYEAISRVQGFPFLGKRIFRLMDAVEIIHPFYPRHDLSDPTFALKIIRNLISGGFGMHLVSQLNRKPLPLIATFPIPAFMAEMHGYKGDIYALCTDTDIARGWVAVDPKQSRIKYLAPTIRVKERLQLYGVPSERITVTGFPIPEEQPAALGKRIIRLDPKGGYRKKYDKLISLYLDPDDLKGSDSHPVTLMFAIGGAGAQASIATKIMRSLSWEISKGSIRLILSAGTNVRIRDRFDAWIKELGLGQFAGTNVDVLYQSDKYRYFEEFNKALNETDILWTKPSELSFYAALGLPIIMAPTLGAQEESNRSWLHMMGAGFEQYDPLYANEWLMDWLNSGWLAEAAMNGFINAPRDSAKRIEDLVLRGIKNEIEDVHFV
ncbi:MAG: hypothetical protein KGI45_01665 [Patescibacteria group bacterium]|nr:hypothetical protein [Patescibacteria group bacterium]